MNMQTPGIKIAILFLITYTLIVAGIIAFRYEDILDEELWLAAAVALILLVPSYIAVFFTFVFDSLIPSGIMCGMGILVLLIIAFPTAVFPAGTLLACWLIDREIKPTRPQPQEEPSYEEESEDKDDIVVCRKCWESNKIGSNFCNRCGAELPKVLFCPECGKRIASDAEFCPFCGKRIPEEPETEC